ncbi:MAG: hypothetical protein PUD59_01135 [bacterium]|nr:hypothetical protein [bacterium]
MEKHKFSAKIKQDALNQALYELNCYEKDLFYIESEIKEGIFKAKKIEIEANTRDEIITEIKKFLTKIIKLMGMDSKFEIKQRDDITYITIFAKNNNILIGKFGKTINALSLLLKQYLYNELGFHYNFILDVGEYKIKNQKRLEKLAKNVAREVSKTKIESKLDPMNSYERRIIHTILSDNKYVTTESTGEEPYRCVVIKPKES